MTLPVLYSLRLCPYAMRARFGLLLAKQQVLLRDVVLTEKPDEMLVTSARGTVPVLAFGQALEAPFDYQKVIDESLDIMLWALQQNDPQQLLHPDEPQALPAMLELINTNDDVFIDRLKKYKSAARYKDETQDQCRQECQPFIAQLEQRLTAQPFFFGQTLSLADYALLPFVRQFAKVDRKWFNQAPYPNLRQWLDNHLQSPLYTRALAKYPRWLDNRAQIVFG